MNELDKTKLSDQTKLRLDEIKKIENYFHEEINQRKLCSKKVKKYVTTFHDIDKILIVLKATTGGICIVSHASVVGTPVGIASTGFTILFSLATRITKKLLKTQEIKRKSMIKFLCSLKVNLITLKV